MNARLKRAPLRAIVSIERNPYYSKPRDPIFRALLSCQHHRLLQLRRRKPVHCIACLIETQETA